MARVIYPASQPRAGIQVKGGWSLTLPRTWRYNPEGNRDLRLDFLRGFCLFVIIADHISFYPAFTIYLTGGGYFLTSAAEGFIFISGLVLGLVYGPRIVKSGLAASTNKILQRAWTLYLWNLIVALAYLMLAYFTPLNTRHEAVGAPPAFTLDLVLKLITLRQGFGWSDLLATYAVLLAVSPILLYFLTQKKTPWIVGLSWGFWLAYQIVPEHFSPEIGTFPIFAWQVLFVNGLVIGYHRETVKKILSKWVGWKLYVPLIATFIGLLALGITWIYAGAFAGNTELTSFLSAAFDKMSLRPGRVLTFLVFMAVFYLTLTYFWEPINRALGWLFRPLGQNSLYVYILHGFVVSIFFNIPSYGDASPLIHTMGHIIAVLTLWSLVKTKFMFNVIPR
jgi:hypothetical protein